MTKTVKLLEISLFEILMTHLLCISGYPNRTGMTNYLTTNFIFTGWAPLFSNHCTICTYCTKYTYYKYWSLAFFCQELTNNHSLPEKSTKNLAEHSSKIPVIRKLATRTEQS